MAVQKVVTYGNSALRAISKNITDFSNIRSLIDDLFDTMYEFDGIGLAANQIGINKRIFVVDLSHTEECESPLVFINGKIISGTLETGNKITSGVSSFFKGIFSSEN